jgi:hypothetical protein
VADRFPRPYVNSVPEVAGGKGGGMMEYVPFKHLGIGARPSGMPGGDKFNEVKSIDHVGKSAEGGKGRR